MALSSGRSSYLQGKGRAVGRERCPRGWAGATGAAAPRGSHHLARKQAPFSQKQAAGVRATDRQNDKPGKGTTQPSLPACLPARPLSLIHTERKKRASPVVVPKDGLESLGGLLGVVVRHGGEQVVRNVRVLQGCRGMVEGGEGVGGREGGSVSGRQLPSCRFTSSMPAAFRQPLAQLLSARPQRCLPAAAAAAPAGAPIGATSTE